MSTFVPWVVIGEGGKSGPVTDFWDVTFGGLPTGSALQTSAAINSNQAGFSGYLTHEVRDLTCSRGI